MESGRPALLRTVIDRLGGRVGWTGFVYVDGENDGPMREAAVGRIVRTPSRQPPWIAVIAAAERVSVVRWPGRLWRVEVVDAARRRDQRLVGGPPMREAGYEQALAVRVLAEEDPSILFGPSGGDIAPIIDQASRLTRGEAERLSGVRHPGAGSAYHRVLRLWAREHGVALTPEDLDGVRGFGAWEPFPGNDALRVICGAVHRRARDLEGDAAVEIVPESDEHEGGVYLLQPWFGAAEVLADAVLALAVAGFAPEEDRATLLAGWGGASGG